MKFEMTAKEMLEFHSLLEKRFLKARSSKEKDFLEKQMDAVYLVLSAALQFTIGNNVENIAKALAPSEIDKDLLSLVVGPDRMRAITMGAQQVIEFTPVETINERVTKDNYKQYPEKKQLDFLMSHSFTKNIAEAVEIFNSMNKSALPNAKAWIAIREAYKNHEPFELWDRYIVNTLLNDGAPKAFLSIKKHLKSWSDMDVALIMNDSINRRTPLEKEGRPMMVVDTLSKVSSMKNYYINDPKTISFISEVEGLSDRTAVCRRIDSIIKHCSPLKRNELLKRKDYEEKGYN
jgi:hypothetical protein